MKMLFLQSLFRLKKKTVEQTVSTATPVPTPQPGPAKVVATPVAAKPAPKAESEPAKATAAVSTPSTSFTPSISSILKGKNKIAEEEKPVVEEKKNNDAFSFDQLMTAWKEFAAIMDDKGNTNLSKALLRRNPELKDDVVVHFTLDNKPLFDELKELRSDLLRHLKEKLNNSFIQLETTIAESTVTTDIAYTAKEKFLKMTEKNPSLDKLRQQFGLELDL